MVSTRVTMVLLTAGAILIPALMYQHARGSDHADTPAIAATPGADLTDVFVFPSPANNQNVVLAMCIHPLIPRDQGMKTSFDPNVLYQFKIANTGDVKNSPQENLVIQARFHGTGSNQTVSIVGPAAAVHPGTISTFPASPTAPVVGIGRINRHFTTDNGMQVFAGAREDPFFFDLDAFFKILPDRASSLSGKVIDNPNAPQATSWRPAGQAQDFLKDLDVLAIVVECPKSLLTGGGNGQVAVWCTTSV